MTKQEEKQQLRRIIRGLRAQLSEAYCLRANRAIAAHLLAMSEYQAAGTVFCYVSTGLEIDTWPVLEDVLASGRSSASLCASPTALWSFDRSLPWPSLPPAPTASQSLLQTTM